MGRLRTDWATRCQTWFWYWALRQLSSLSDDGLDSLIREVSAPIPFRSRKKRKVIRRAIAADSRRRIFNRIKHFAYEPRPRRYHGKVMSLVDILETQIPGSAAMHKSHLWELLRTPRPSLDRIREIRDEISGLYGLHLLTAEEQSVVATLDLSGLLMRDATKGSVDKHFIKYLSGNVDANILTFLSCLYIEAVTMSWLTEAIYFKAILDGAISGFIRRYSVPNPAQALLQFLMEERVIKNLHGQENVDNISHFSRAVALDEFPSSLSHANTRPLVVATLSDEAWYPDLPHFHWIWMTPAANTFFEKYALLNREAHRRRFLEFARKKQLEATDEAEGARILNSYKRDYRKPDTRAVKAIKRLKAQIKKI